MSDCETKILNEGLKIKQEIEIKEEILESYVETEYSEELPYFTDEYVSIKCEPYIYTEELSDDENYNQEGRDFVGFTIAEQEKSKEKVNKILTFLHHEFGNESSEREFVGFTYIQQQKNKEKLNRFLSLVKLKQFSKENGKNIGRIACKTKDIFKCCKCNFKTRFKSWLKRHCNSHIKKFYKCSDCNFNCKLLGQFKKHILSHSMKSNKTNEYYKELSEEILTDPVKLMNEYVLDERLKDCHFLFDNSQKTDLNLPNFKYLIGQEVNPSVSECNIEKESLYPILAF